MKKQHYTLTDLCITLLTVILFAGVCTPLFTASAAQARKAACADIQKKIANVAFSYAEDYDDYSVPQTKIGWMRYLSAYDKSMTPASYLCPEDNVKRKHSGGGFSFSLNTGHIWNFRQTNTNKKEWGMVSPITGTPIQISQAPEPSSTAWFKEFWNEAMNYRQVCNVGDRSAFSTYSLEGFHDNGTTNSVLFLDGHTELINKNDWKRGDARGVVFQDIHGTCIPNMH